MNLEKLFEAYYECRKNKRRTRSAIEFEMHYERYLFELYDDIRERRYEIGQSIIFIVDHPVKREICAGSFRDRVVHHYIVRGLEPVLEKLFIYDAYACRKHKGTLFGIRRAESYIRSCSQGYSHPCFALQLDIQGFFMSIDRGILLSKLEMMIDENFGDGEEDHREADTLLYLIQQILATNPIDNCIIRGKRTDWIGLPRTKSLFFAQPWRWLPIGNLTSQIFANLYMHELDIFIKKNLAIRYYGRYMDDLLLVHHDREYLVSCIPMIRDFALCSLWLTLHPDKTQLRSIQDGFLFLWAYIQPYRTYIGNRTKDQFHRCIIQSRYTMPDPRLVSQMNSYLGQLSHFATFSLRKKFLAIFFDTPRHENFSIGNSYKKIQDKL